MKRHISRRNQTNAQHPFAGTIHWSTHLTMNRSHKSLTASLLGILLVAGYAGAATVIDFTSAEGYTDGVLNNQPGTSGTWKTTGTSTFTGFQVDTSNGGSVALDTTASSKIAGYATPVYFMSSGPVTMSMEFQFSQTAASVASATNTFGLVFASSQNAAGSTTGLAWIGRAANTTDGYRLTAFGANSVSVTGAQLGINSASSDNLSDVIRLTLTLTAVTSTSWNGTATLYNVTTGTQIGITTRNNITSAADLNNAMYGGFQIGSQMAASSLSSASVLNYTTTAVPEPGAYVLLGLGLGFVAVYVRRRKASVSC